jgi:proteic killer suppression protein
MIKSFRSQGLAAFFRTGSTRKVPAKHARRLRTILTMLNVAARTGQLDAPGLGLRPLAGEQEGCFVVDVNERYRIAFRFEGPHAMEVGYDECR